MGLTLGYTLMNRPIQQEILASAQIPVVQALPIVQPIPKADLIESTLQQAKKTHIEYKPENPIPNEDALAVAIPEKRQRQRDRSRL